MKVFKNIILSFLFLMISLLFIFKGMKFCRDEFISIVILIGLVTLGCFVIYHVNISKLLFYIVLGLLLLVLGIIICNYSIIWFNNIHKIILFIVISANILCLEGIIKTIMTKIYRSYEASFGVIGFLLIIIAIVPCMFYGNSAKYDVLNWKLQNMKYDFIEDIKAYSENIPVSYKNMQEIKNVTINVYQEFIKIEQELPTIESLSKAEIKVQNKEILTDFIKVRDSLHRLKEIDDSSICINLEAILASIHPVFFIYGYSWKNDNEKLIWQGIALRYGRYYFDYDYISHYKIYGVPVTYHNQWYFDLENLTHLIYHEHSIEYYIMFYSTEKMIVKLNYPTHPDGKETVFERMKNTYEN